MNPPPCRMFVGLAPAFSLLFACSPVPDEAPAAGAGAGPGIEPAGNATLVGEWSPDRGLCGESRLSFTADGLHEALLDDGGGWQVLATGRYELDGRELSIRFEGVLQQREVVSVDEGTLVLRHDDEELAAVTGGYDVVLQRCPDRAPPSQA